MFTNKDVLASIGLYLIVLLDMAKEIINEADSDDIPNNLGDMQPGHGIPASTAAVLRSAQDMGFGARKEALLKLVAELSTDGIRASREVILETPGLLDPELL
ncbi:MAG: hypothetical protein H6765_01900 [Candidatus Peribacteria bacterium]|nr:MAG: hypothetical protein H6765_01900 [Candidatus Peribacteria bacterium]